VTKEKKDKKEKRKKEKKKRRRKKKTEKGKQKRKDTKAWTSAETAGLCWGSIFKSGLLILCHVPVVLLYTFHIQKRVASVGERRNRKKQCSFKRIK
jgi:hypothetical protein